MTANTATATPAQIAAAQVLIDHGVEELDEDVPTAAALVAHLRDVVLEFTPLDDWTDAYYAVILSAGTMNEHIETDTEKLGYRRYRVTRRAYVTRGRVLIAEGTAVDTTITKAHKAAGLALIRARRAG